MEFGLNGALHTPQSAEKLAQFMLTNPLLSSMEKALFSFLVEWFNKEDYVEVSTSGSTGKPKTIRALKDRMRYSAQLTISRFNLGNNQNALLCLDPAYIAGKMMIVRAIEAGMNLIIADPKGNVLTGIREPIHFAAMVPIQVEASMEDLDKVEQLIIGGAPVNQVTKTKLQALDTRCFATYGMTETVSHVAVQPLNGPSRSDQFEAMPHIAFTTDERDCLCIIAPFFNDDPIQTNDVVDLISETNFKWKGRADFVINSGGLKLHPEEIEHKLKAFIEPDYFIIGMSDNRLGQKAVLVVEGEKRDVQWPESLLTKYEGPKDVFFVSEFVRTPTGKTDRLRTFQKVMR